MSRVPPVRPVPLPVTLPGQARVWVASVSENVCAAEARRHELDRTEQARAARLRRDDDADRFLVAHVCLRALLGERLGAAPGRLLIEREPCAGCGGPHGRPYLPGRPVHFSLSHAGDLVLVALAPVPVGVDVEPERDASLIGDTVDALHDVERAELLGLPARARGAAFARCWARKEAALKSTGTGLVRGASQPYVGSGLVPAQPDGHHVLDLPAPPGHAAALALHLG
ncbi:hypothetical protein ADK55_26990 [Streptomyces sp. WM4235]|nr:hypothetical protein ADK55_26990 [Streptomyces sp. WM4235]